MCWKTHTANASPTTVLANTFWQPSRLFLPLSQANTSPKVRPASGNTSLTLMPLMQRLPGYKYYVAQGKMACDRLSQLLLAKETQLWMGHAAQPV